MDDDDGTDYDQPNHFVCTVTVRWEKVEEEEECEIEAMPLARQPRWKKNNFINLLSTRPTPFIFLAKEETILLARKFVYDDDKLWSE